MKLKGYACGIGAAVSYGLNPLGAQILSAVMLIIAGKSFSINNMATLARRFGHVLVKHWRWK